MSALPSLVGVPSAQLPGVVQLSSAPAPFQLNTAPCARTASRPPKAAMQSSPPTRLAISRLISRSPVNRLVESPLGARFITEHVHQARGAGAPPANRPDSSRKTGGV